MVILGHLATGTRISDQVHVIKCSTCERGITEVSWNQYKQPTKEFSAWLTENKKDNVQRKQNTFNWLIVGKIYFELQYIYYHMCCGLAYIQSVDVGSSERCLF